MMKSCSLLCFCTAGSLVKDIPEEEAAAEKARMRSCKERQKIIENEGNAAGQHAETVAECFQFRDKVRDFSSFIVLLRGVDQGASGASMDDPGVRL